MSDIGEQIMVDLQAKDKARYEKAAEGILSHPSNPCL